jgi:hypothetical protein
MGEAPPLPAPQTLSFREISHANWPPTRVCGTRRKTGTWWCFDCPWPSGGAFLQKVRMCLSLNSSLMKSHKARIVEV